MTIRLLIADDHDLIREGLRATFEDTEIEIVGEAATGCEAVRMALSVDAGVMLLDLRLPHRDGFEVLQEVKQARPQLAVLIYTQHDRNDFRERALRLGASGYLTKRILGRELIDAVRKTNETHCRCSGSNDSFHEEETDDPVRRDSAADLSECNAR